MENVHLHLTAFRLVRVQGLGTHFVFFKTPKPKPQNLNVTCGVKIHGGSAHRVGKDFGSWVLDKELNFSYHNRDL